MIYPMMMMVLLTFIVGLLAVKTRFASVKSKAINVKYFTLMQGENIPDVVTKTTRCFNNQFEVPILFYVAATLYISLGVDNTTGLVAAWSFVVLRYLHAYIHLTYNHILHRLSVFWLAFIAAMVMWISVVVNQL